MITVRIIPRSNSARRKRAERRPPYPRRQPYQAENRRPDKCARPLKAGIQGHLKGVPCGFLVKIYCQTGKRHKDGTSRHEKELEHLLIEHAAVKKHREGTEDGKRISNDDKYDCSFCFPLGYPSLEFIPPQLFSTSTHSQRRTSYTAPGFGPTRLTHSTRSLREHLWFIALNDADHLQDFLMLALQTFQKNEITDSICP